MNSSKKLFLKFFRTKASCTKLKNNKSIGFNSFGKCRPDNYREINNLSLWDYEMNWVIF